MGGPAMIQRSIWVLVCAAGVAAVHVAPAFAEVRQIQGIVVTNANGQLTIKTPQGDQTIALPDSTRVRSIAGPLGGQKETVPVTALIPGLPVTIDADDSS